MLKLLGNLIMLDSANLREDENRNTFSKKVVFSKPQVDSIFVKNKKIKTILIQESDPKTESLKYKKEILAIEKENDLKKEEMVDDNKRMFLKVAGVAGLGLAASALLPKTADAYVAGSTPTSNVVGLKDGSNDRINPATEETLSELIAGQGVSKLTKSLLASGVVHTPTSGKKIRVYASRFSLTADATSVSFRFTAGGTDHEKYVSPKTGGLYGANNHPNYIEGGVDEVLYCEIDGATTIQINIDYLEV